MPRLPRLIIILTALLLTATVARAEGPLTGGTRLYLDGEPVGQLTLSSFAAPNPPVTTDNLWVTVQLRDGALAVTDARVLVRVAPQAGGDTLETEATHDLAPTRFDYTARFPVPREGLYDVQVQVEHPLGAGEVGYVVSVSEPLTRYIFLLMGIPFLLVALWLVWRFGVKRPRRARAGGDSS